MIYGSQVGRYRALFVPDDIPAPAHGPMGLAGALSGSGLQFSVVPWPVLPFHSLTKAESEVILYPNLHLGLLGGTRPATAVTKRS
jgi:hypothetical protein